MLRNWIFEFIDFKLEHLILEKRVLYTKIKTNSIKRLIDMHWEFLYLFNKIKTETWKLVYASECSLLGFRISLIICSFSSISHANQVQLKLSCKWLIFIKEISFPKSTNKFNWIEIDCAINKIIWIFSKIIQYSIESVYEHSNQSIDGSNAESKSNHWNFGSMHEQ